MASGKRSGETDFDYCDVGLGLKLQRHHHSSADDCMPTWHSPSTHGRNNSCISTSTCSFMAGSGTRMAFTEGQRQELERQTMIYKYMISSLPVPPELLIPLSKASLSEDAGRRTGRTNRSELRGTVGMNKDAEPWRCRRTDGKKWRCSRDVAPDQKYCDRHSHKGRPSRSRKPVESLLLSPPSTTSSSYDSNPSAFLSPFHLRPFSLPQYHFPGYPDWCMKKDVVPADQGLYRQQHIPGESIGNISYMPQKGSCVLSWPFIDAWSLGDVPAPKDPSRNTPASDTISTVLPLPSQVSSNKSPPLNSILPLTLSMSADLDPDHDSTPQDAKDPSVRDIRSSHQQHLNWMPSWISSPPGGPLAEALFLGMSDHANSLAAHSDELVSPHANSSSSSATTPGSKGSHASADTNHQGFQFH